MNRFKCCICGDVYWGFGNNPYPYDKNPKHRCCDDCNTMFVIPSRIELVNRVVNKEDESDEA